MNLLAAAVVDSVDWKQLRSGSGNAEGVSGALAALADAQTEEEAAKQYWRIDNVVVVQGSLYESALPVVWVALALLTGPLPPEARYRVVELLVEIAGGETAQAEVEAGNADLAERCRAALREGLWSFYAFLLDSDPRTRSQGITLLGWLEDRTSLIVPILTSIATRDDDERVRGEARALLDEFTAE
jgi:hypothetical protein